VNPRELLDLDRRHVLRPYTAVDDPRPPLVVTSAQGSHVVGADGRRYLDGNSSWWVAGLGHRHPRLVAAAKAQLDVLPHVALAGITHEPAARLAAELTAIAPAGLDRVFFSDDGSTAIEAALKLAIQYYARRGRPQKTGFVALGGAFHGETVGATSLGGVELFRRASAPLLFPVRHAQGVAAAAELVAAHAEALAAVVVEPIVQGAAGMVFSTPAELAQLARVCRTHDVLLIADEVFTGFGRTGAMWAMDHASVAPDLMCLGKTFSGGMLPFAATLLPERVAEVFRGGREHGFLHGHSYCGNPLGAAIAREVLAIFRDEAIVAGVQRKAGRLAAAITRASQAKGASGARAIGLVGAVDLAPSGPGASGYLDPIGWRVYDEGLARGALLRPLGNTVYLAPPLTISDADLDELCGIFEAAVLAATDKGD
jgi:adenosylmethionine-8-amino-7-oxononanoate aminotransferase